MIKKEVYPEYTVYKIKIGTNTRVFNISNWAEDHETLIEQLINQTDDLSDNNIEDGNVSD